MKNWKTYRPVFGDRIVVISNTNDGVIIAHFGVMLADGLGRPYGRNRCDEGHFWNDTIPRESPKFTLVMVPEYNSELGVLDWTRYSARTSRVTFDCVSIRDADAHTRDMIKAKQWQAKLEHAERDAKRNVNKKLIQALFDLSPYEPGPRPDQLVEFLVNKNVIPAPDIDQIVANAVRETLKEFTKEQAVSGPTDF